MGCGGRSQPRPYEPVSIRGKGPNLKKTMTSGSMKADQDAERGAAMRHARSEVGGRNPAGSAASASNPTSEERSLIVQEQKLIEEMIERGNLNAAWKQVKRNKGSAGMDGRDIEDTAALIRERWEEIETHLLTGTYRPRPVKRVEIPKVGGGKRKLGVPTVLDRFIQQAVLQVIMPLFEPHFSEHSYGFRPGRSALQAVEQARQYQQSGKRWVVDLDLASFFDEISHDLLMARVRRKVKDKRMLKLIRAFLHSGVMAGGLTQPTDKGTPQGGPLSPLLSNILLDQLDRELERRGHAFCRYADDCNIYVQSRRSGERVMASISTYVEKRLKLKVNREKSAVDRPVRRVFLGYSFTVHRKTRIRVPKKSVQKMKSKLKDLFRQGRGRNLQHFIQETLNPVLRGWMHYFRLAETKLFAEELDSWIRRRLRCIVWRQWKRGSTRFRKLKGRGLDPERARKSAWNGRGPWFNSGASHMNQAFPRKSFDAMNLLSLLDLLRSLQRTSS